MWLQAQVAVRKGLTFEVDVLSTQSTRAPEVVNGIRESMSCNLEILVDLKMKVADGGGGEASAKTVGTLQSFILCCDCRDVEVRICLLVSPRLRGCGGRVVKACDLNTAIACSNYHILYECVRSNRARSELFVQITELRVRGSNNPRLQCCREVDQYNSCTVSLLHDKDPQINSRHGRVTSRSPVTLG